MMRRSCTHVISGALLAFGVLPAQAETLALKGVSGYLSEWELSGDLVERADRAATVLTSSVVLKHTGLCSTNEPEQKTGELRATIVRSWRATRLTGTLSLGKTECAVAGMWDGRFTGAMECPDARGVPISFTIDRERRISTASDRTP